MMASVTVSQSAFQRIQSSGPALLLRAAHPRQAFFATLAMTAAAAAAGRPDREVALVAATVATGQCILGWHNDLVDADADARHQRIKPVVDGLDRSTLSFALSCAILLFIPLAVSNGLVAAACYGTAIVVAMIGNLRWRLVRMGPLSWLPWAASFALYPAFLSYGGWGGHASGTAPSPTLTVLAGLLGIGVHFFSSLWGLVADDNDRWRYLPLWLARRTSANTVLVGTIIFLGITGAAIAVVAQQTGLSA